jgi:hypothetical protein
MNRTSRWPGASAQVAAALAMVMLMLIAAASATASGDDHDSPKLYTAAISTSPAIAEDDAPADPAAEVWAGASPQVAITITNRASEQRLGSADVAVPDGVALTGSPLLASSQSPFGGTVSAAPGVIRLRNLSLKPGRSVTVTVAAQIECSAAHPAYAFTVVAKQANDFNGTGNDFTISGLQPALDVVGACALSFQAQPADAQRNSAITSEVFLPTGAPVSVAVVDGSGSATVAWWTAPVTLGLGSNPGGAPGLGGTTSATPVAGVASFSPGPILGVSASGYRLTASSPGIVAAQPLSGTFTVVDSGVRCTAGQSCTAASTATKSTASVSGLATGANDLLRVSLGSPTATAFVCAGYTTTTEVLDFDLTSLTGGVAGGPKTAAFTLRAPFVTRAADRYEACFLSPLPFTTKSGAPAQAVDTDGNGSADSFVGLLPTCSSCGDDDRSRSRVTVCPPPPYVASKVKDRYGNVTLTIIAPPGDPRAKF